LLLADVSLIPSNLSKFKAGSVSNEEASWQFKNTNEIFAFLENSGLVNNYHLYQSNALCDENGSIKYIRSTVSRFDTAPNAIHFFNIYKDERKNNSNTIKYEEVSSVGDKAFTYIYVWTDENRCSPAGSRVIDYSLCFQRYNILSEVRIYVVA